MSEKETPVIAFVGHPDSGKTTLASQVTRYFHNRGLEVLSVVEADAEDDAIREKFAIAGAAEVRFVAGSEGPADGAFDPDRRFDVVVADGMIRSGAPKVFVFRTEEQAALLTDALAPVVAAVTKGSFSKDNDAGLPVYYFHELDDLVDELERRFLRGDSSDIV
ncbi:molybdopterin-guanine dinucleotide biosynthesis protein B [Paenibacillus antri]|uniref:Molybdopterin-guanine dinucleotide biosynthesis protein B n=1 Tax=Paenibacillus antri TaxID=2582848 RepID=A0A5R9GCN5_9BACL|nr:molybdopterin-guanine dinucleotide biosynthesis protein B [Paenibacillus antri]TLS54237.1 molybdopterin-guanine dinucleotide biosynthesis protein B [Paenibacillus antri]